MARGTPGPAAGGRCRTRCRGEPGPPATRVGPLLLRVRGRELLRHGAGAATVTEARALPAGLPVPGRRPFLASTIGLVAGKGVEVGGGVLFWVVAARAAPPVELALVAAVVSAVMLCTQLGQMGT